MPMTPLSSPTASNNSDTSKRTVTFLDPPASPPSSNASSSGRLSLHRRWRQVMGRKNSSASLQSLTEEQQVSAPVQQLRVPLHRMQSYEQRQQQEQAVPKRQLPWLKAALDEQQFNLYEKKLIQLSLHSRNWQRSLAIDDHDAIHAARAALDVAQREAAQAISDFQAYLRNRTVETSQELQIFKEKEERKKAGNLARIIDPSDLKMWRDLNSSDTLALVAEGKQSLLSTPEAAMFLAKNEARNDQLTRLLQQEKQQLQQNAQAPLSHERCKELLMEVAGDAVIEQGLIQYYMELTMLTRCQLHAMAARDRLNAAWRGA